MEPTEAAAGWGAGEWGPSEFLQVANWWSVEEPPAAEFPLEYTSIDIFDTCCNLQGPMAASIEGLQPVQLYYDSAEGPKRTTLISNREEDSISKQPENGNKQTTEVQKENNGDDATTVETKISNNSRVSDVFKQVASEFEADVKLMKEKMHRYPASLRDTIDECYMVPRFVAIGPYHHGKPQVKKAETLKHMAAYHCVKELGRLVEDLYARIASAADNAHHLYDKDVMASISDVDFRDMMFLDACFLVQYMRMRSGKKNKIDRSLHDSMRMRPNTTDILHDIMLLENQLPWTVVQAVKGSFPATATTPSFLPDFISKLRGCLLDEKLRREDKPTVDLGDGYKPPHLLGLIRNHIVGRSYKAADNKSKGARKPKRSVSQSAIELAKIGIMLTPVSHTTELIHMSLDVDAGILHGELSVPPVSLNLNRASYLVNMAALEMCTVPSFGAAGDQDSAVCSYLLLLAMLAYREEDVHELRERGLLQGGGGLTNQDVLRFFTSLQCLRLGKRYLNIMEEIGRYKENRTEATTVNRFWYDNKKSIAAVFGVLVSLASIVGTLVSIKTAL